MADTEQRGRMIYFEPLGRRVREYVAIFWRHNGSGPWACHFCPEEVMVLGRGEGVIHHLDEDHTNQSPVNLVAAHWKCHARFHTGQRTPTPATLEALKAGREMSPSAETRRRIGASRSRPTPERLAREISEKYASGEGTYRSLMREYGIGQHRLQVILGRETPAVDDHGLT